MGVGNVACPSRAGEKGVLWVNCGAICVDEEVFCAASVSVECRVGGSVFFLCCLRLVAAVNIPFFGVVAVDIWGDFVSDTV